MSIYGEYNSIDHDKSYCKIRLEFKSYASENKLRNDENPRFTIYLVNSVLLHNTMILKSYENWKEYDCNVKPSLLPCNETLFGLGVLLMSNRVQIEHTCAMFNEHPLPTLPLDYHRKSMWAKEDIKL